MIQIRKFRLSDYEEIVNLWQKTGLVLRPGDDLEGIRLKLKRDRDLFLIAEKDHKIVGVVIGAWDGRRGWINHLAVSPNFRRLGVARSLLDEVEKRLANKGALKVNAQVYRRNKRSLAFFRALGYEVHADLLMVGKTIRRRG
ncbi:MAG TPA: GNAT family acetyltransferase [Candidatus Bathyarchaeia archaeon]|nr:GNAT family acetyltransferase [Candidatus Bathyarchaeia archaeon]